MRCGVMWWLKGWARCLAMPQLRILKRGRIQRKEGATLAAGVGKKQVANLQRIALKSNRLNGLYTFAVFRIMYIMSNL